MRRGTYGNKGNTTHHRHGEIHHSARHSDRKVRVALMLASFDWGDVSIGYLLNTHKSTVQRWRQNNFRRFA